MTNLLSINQAFEIITLAFETLEYKYNFDKDFLACLREHASLEDITKLLIHLNNQNSFISFKID